MNIICVGHATYDITLPFKKYPLENTKIRTNVMSECGGGPASNAAYLLSKWGVNTYFVGMVGNDYYGNRIKEEFNKVGTNLNYFYVSDNCQTTVSYILVNLKTGSRTVLSYVNDDQPKLDIDVAVKPDIILIDGHEPLVSFDLIKNNPNSISIIDAGRDSKEVIELCKLVDYVVCSKSFAESVTGYTCNKTTMKKIFNVMEKMFKGKIIVTLERKGCAYKEENEIVIVPSIDVKTIDSTGAGDIFHGAFAYGIAKKWKLYNVLKFANIVGAMSTTKLGGRNSIFSLKEIKKVLDEFK